jgi:Fe-S-cluster-containing hydrogenase component 2
MLVIEIDRCEGCGACVHVCPKGAISLVDGLARIDSVLCSECQTCVQACPMGAIRVAAPIAHSEPTSTDVAYRRESALGSTLVRESLATATAATVTFVGQYLLPRAIEALSRALMQPPGHVQVDTETRLSSSPVTSRPSAANSYGGRRRRHRGGQ